MDLRLVGVAIGNLINRQPSLARRKDTIVTVITGLIWVLAFITPSLAALPLWVGLVIGGIGTVGGALVNALTQGAITPSMIDRVKGEITEIQNVSVSLIEPEPGLAEAVADEQPDSTPEYVGEHRAPEIATEGGIGSHYTNQ